MERMKTQVELLKECGDIKDAACVRYQKRIAKLEEENKKLKEELDKYKKQYQHSMGFSDFGGYDEDEHIVKDENTYRDLDL